MSSPLPLSRVLAARGQGGEALRWAREEGLSVDDDLSYLRPLVVLPSGCWPDVFCVSKGDFRPLPPAAPDGDCRRRRPPAAGDHAGRCGGSQSQREPEMRVLTVYAHHDPRSFCHSVL